MTEDHKYQNFYLQYITSSKSSINIFDYKDGVNFDHEKVCLGLNIQEIDKKKYIFLPIIPIYRRRKK